MVDDQGNLGTEGAAAVGEGLAVGVAEPDDGAVVAAEMGALLGLGGLGDGGLVDQSGDQLVDQGDISQLGVRAGDEGIVIERAGNHGHAGGRQGRTSLEKRVSKEMWYMVGNTNLHGEGGKSQKTRVDLHLDCCVVDRGLDCSL